MRTRKFSELRKQFHAEHPEVLKGREERIQKLTEHGERYQRTLSEIRKARVKTQVEVAQALDLDQPQISKLEKRTDVYLSTLEKYIRALGGRLEVVAVFDDERYPVQLADLAGDTEAAPEPEQKLALAG